MFIQVMLLLIVIFCSLLYLILAVHNNHVHFSAVNSFAIVSQLEVIRGFTLATGNHAEAMVPIGGPGMHLIS